MIKILLSFLKFLGTAINFLISTVNSLFSLIANIPTYIQWLVGVVAVLPEILIPFIVASISIYAVLFILGRESS